MGKHAISADRSVSSRRVVVKHVLIAEVQMDVREMIDDDDPEPDWHMPLNKPVKAVQPMVTSELALLLSLLALIAGALIGWFIGDTWGLD
jgi:hypothetical protein